MSSRGHTHFRQNFDMLILFCIGTGIILLFLPYFLWLYDLWQKHPFNTFGYLAPFVSAWAVFYRRKEIRGECVGSYAPGWLFFAFGMILLFLFYWTDQAIAASAGLPFFIYGLILIFWGKGKGRYLAFSVFFLLFLYPWGDFLDFLFGYELRHFSLFVSFIFFRIMNAKAAIEGTLLFTGRFMINIAPACSGIATMNVLLFMGAVGVYIYRGSITSRIIILLSVIPLAIILNTFRIIITGLIGHYHGGEIAIGFYDNLSGMFVFGLAMLFLYCEGLLLKRRERNSIKTP